MGSTYESYESSKPKPSLWVLHKDFLQNPKIDENERRAYSETHINEALSLIRKLESEDNEKEGEKIKLSLDETLRGIKEKDLISYYPGSDQKTYGKRFHQAELNKVEQAVDDWYRAHMHEYSR